MELGSGGRGSIGCQKFECTTDDLDFVLSHVMPRGKGQSRRRASGPCVLSAGGSENSSPSLLVRSSLQMRQFSWRGRQDRPPNILLILFVMRPTPLFRSKRCNINYEACSTSYTWLPSMYIFSYYIFLTFNKQSEQFCPNPSYPYLCTGQLNYYAVVNERAHCAADTCRVTHNKHHSPESPVSTNGLGSREGVPNRGKAPCGRGGSGEEEGWMRTDVPIHKGHALLTLGENSNVMTCLRLTCLYRVRSQALS